MRQVYPELILLDGGDFGEAVIGVNTWKTAELFGTLRALGYDAIGLGERDMAWAFFEEMAKGGGKEILLGGNWRPAAEISVPSVLLIERKSFTLGVTEVVSPVLQTGQAALSKDSQVLLREQLAELTKRKADVLVVIYHGAASEALALRQNTPEVDLWLLSHGIHQPLSQVSTNDGALVVGPGDRGRELGFVAVRKNKEDGTRSGAFTQVVLDQRIADSPRVGPFRQSFYARQAKR